MWLNRLLHLIIVISGLIVTLTAQNTDECEWWKHTSIYQIYPRSFMDSDNDGVGDIQGIISRLDYIRDLGFNTIWISPFFKSPQRDFGYDISNYLAIDPLFGKMEDAEQLIKEIHNRNMHVVFDLVLNHTSDEHPWFIESVDRKNNKTDWYIWKGGPGKKPPNNWKSLTVPNGWHYNEQRKQWYWASFMPFQPDLNWRNPEVEKTMFDMARFWLNKGVDGFRLDIFNVIYEDSTFRKNPKKLNPFPTDESPSAGFQKLKNSMNHPDNYHLAKKLRQLIDEYEHPKRFVIGEVFGPHEEIGKFPGENADGLNLIFLFDMKRFHFNARFFHGQLKKYEKFYASPKVPVYVYSNHDDRRSMSRINGSVEKAKLLAMFQLMARGVAVTYQGEEIGMTDAKIPRKEAKDPLAKIYKLPQFIVDCLPLLINRDECRTPFQWDTTANAGFSISGVKPWLPVNNNYKKINVFSELMDSSTLIYNYKKLLKLRNSIDCLKYGTLEILETPKIDKNILAFKRLYLNEEILVLINFSKKTVFITIDDKYSDILFNTHKGKIDHGSKLKLEAFQGIVIK